MNTTPNSAQRTRRRQPRKATDVAFEINLVDGAEAERLGVQQATVIRDVVLWHHRNCSSAPPDYENTKLACTTKHPT